MESLSKCQEIVVIQHEVYQIICIIKNNIYIYIYMCIYIYIYKHILTYLKHEFDKDMLELN